MVEKSSPTPEPERDLSWVRYDVLARLLQVYDTEAEAGAHAVMWNKSDICSSPEMLIAGAIAQFGKYDFADSLSNHLPEIFELATQLLPRWENEEKLRPREVRYDDKALALMSPEQVENEKISCHEGKVHYLEWLDALKALQDVRVPLLAYALCQPESYEKLAHHRRH